jgi:transketolase
MPNLRLAYFKELSYLMERDNKIIFVTSDLGYSYFEYIKNRFKEQFLNTGCIEQTAIGICGGLAKAGFKPYFYSTITFGLIRTLEFIRDDVCYNNLNVKIVCYASADFLGFSHNIVEDEDLQILEKLPHIKSFIPKDEKQLKDCIRITYRAKCPTYIRL